MHSGVLVSFEHVLNSYGILSNRYIWGYPGWFRHKTDVRDMQAVGDFNVFGSLNHDLRPSSPPISLMLPINRIVKATIFDARLSLK